MAIHTTTHLLSPELHVGDSVNLGDRWREIICIERSPKWTAILCKDGTSYSVPADEKVWIRNWYVTL